MRKPSNSSGDSDPPSSSSTTRIWSSRIGSGYLESGHTTTPKLVELDGDPTASLTCRLARRQVDQSTIKTSPKRRAIVEPRVNRPSLSAPTPTLGNSVSVISPTTGLVERSVQLRHALRRFAGGPRRRGGRSRRVNRGRVVQRRFMSSRPHIDERGVWGVVSQLTSDRMLVGRNEKLPGASAFGGLWPWPAWQLRRGAAAGRDVRAARQTRRRGGEWMLQ